MSDYVFRYLHLKGSVLIQYNRAIQADLLADIEINFNGRPPRSAISFHLQVDDTAHDFQPEGSARNVTWNCGMCVTS